MVARILGALALLGFDPRVAVRSVRGVPHYVSTYFELRRQGRASSRPMRFGTIYPCLADRYTPSGAAKGHYFHQDLLVARRIHERSPRRHVDVGSRIDGFVAHVAAFRPLDVLDVRRLDVDLPNITFHRLDLMEPLDPAWVEASDSLSCLHALEHFGLGRYGDPVSVDGHLLGLDNLRRMLVDGGTLYLSVPIGADRIEFNAHRVFSVASVLDMVDGSFELARFSYVDDEGALHDGVDATSDDAATSFGCSFGCGIFELTKLARDS